MPDNFALRVIHHRDGPVLTVTKLKPNQLCNASHVCIKQKKNNDQLHYSLLDNLDGAAAYIAGTIEASSLQLKVEVYNESSGEVLVKWKYPHSNDQIQTMMAIKSMLKSMQVIVHREN